jgi:hypothetical protein
MTWRISMIFFFCEMHKLHWAFCPHVLFIDLISLGLYIYIYIYNFIFKKIKKKNFRFFLANFNRRVLQVCGNIMGPRTWEFI